MLNGLVLYSQKDNENLFDKYIMQFDSISNKYSETLLIFKNYNEIERDTLKIFYNENDNKTHLKKIYFKNGDFIVENTETSTAIMKKFNAIFKHETITASCLNNSMSNLPTIEIRYKSKNENVKLYFNQTINHKMYSKEFVKILKEIGKEYL